MNNEEIEKSDLFQLKLKTAYNNGYQDGMAKQKEQDKCPEMCVRSHCIGCPKNQYTETTDTLCEKIHGWVARDYNNDPFTGEGLIVHSKKPKRIGDCWSGNTIVFHIPWEFFPDLKWEDEPIEVEITISKSK